MLLHHNYHPCTNLYSSMTIILALSISLFNNLSSEEIKDFFVYLLASYKNSISTLDNHLDSVPCWSLISNHPPP